MTLRVALIGCVESTRVTLDALLGMPPSDVEVVGVVTRRASTYNADFADVTTPAAARSIPVLHVEDAKDDASQAAWLRARGPDLVFCVGWSSLLGAELMRVAPRGVVGYHPAELPANRGRHPLIWALGLGLRRTASTLFFIEAEADSGPILNQLPLDIGPADDATVLYASAMAVLPGQVRDVVRGLARGTLVPRPQNASLATHWRKRSARDGTIDWRMSAASVFNLVRAITRPYPGAEVALGDRVAKVWRCEIEPEAPANAEPGKVLRVEGRHLTVKCGEGAIRLLDHELPDGLKTGDYL